MSAANLGRPSHHCATSTTEPAQSMPAATRFSETFSRRRLSDFDEGLRMDFTLSKEQELLRDGLARFLSTRYDLEKSRAAAKTGAGWQPDIWRGFADELGILGAALPEEVGGIGGGATEVMVIAEALGHALVIEPYVDTVVVAGGLLRRAGNTALLSKIVEGTAIVALAAAEAGSGE